MPLFVVATPIGNPADISRRAVDALAGADLVIGEELKCLRQILKAAGVQAKAMDQLNEHSGARDIEHFVGECAAKNVVLVSDCGTPGFCDPGAELVAACAKAGVAVKPVPGASSLMALLSVAGVRLERFLFYGFLSPKNEDRARELKTLRGEKQPFILMETPYRADRLRADLAENFPNAFCVVGLNLTGEGERILRGKAKDLPKLEDSEPIVLVVP